MEFGILPNAYVLGARPMEPVYLLFSYFTFGSFSLFLSHSQLKTLVGARGYTANAKGENEEKPWQWC